MSRHKTTLPATRCEATTRPTLGAIRLGLSPPEMGGLAYCDSFSAWASSWSHKSCSANYWLRLSLAVALGATRGLASRPPPPPSRYGFSTSLPHSSPSPVSCYGGSYYRSARAPPPVSGKAVSKSLSHIQKTRFRRNTLSRSRSTPDH